MISHVPTCVEGNQSLWKALISMGASSTTGLAGSTGPPLTILDSSPAEPSTSQTNLFFSMSVLSWLPGKLNSVTLIIWRNRKKNIALILKIKCLMFTMIEAAGRFCDRKSVHKLENFWQVIHEWSCWCTSQVVEPKQKHLHLPSIAKKNIWSSSIIYIKPK